MQKPSINLENLQELARLLVFEEEVYAEKDAAMCSPELAEHKLYDKLSQSDKAKVGFAKLEPRSMHIETV